MLSENRSHPLAVELPVEPNYRVTVTAPARLHMGFLDAGGSLGRKYGSIGVGINEIVTRLTLVRADGPSATGPGADRALAMAEEFGRAVGRSCPAAIHIGQAIPGHSGLGSGTQLGLAVGVGLSRLYGLGLAVRDVAARLERGARSGIGIAVFEDGGLVVDGGRGERTVVPPVLVRLKMPAAWRFLLVLDHRDQGLHGKAEMEAFQDLPVFPAEEAARLCHRLLMQGLPAVAEGDIRSFGAAITELQRAVGDHFAPAQGGRFASRDVAEALDFLASRGAVGIGQSSWGPTGFCLLERPEPAETLLAKVRERFGHRSGLEFLMGTARNQGAEIVVQSPDPK